MMSFLTEPSIVNNSASLRKAVRRTVAVSSPLLRPVRFGRDESVLDRWMLGYGDRLSELTAWASVMGDSWLDFVCETAADRAIAGDIAKFATAGACDFLNAVVRQSPPEGGERRLLVQQYVAEISRTMEDFCSAEEWARWTRFILANEGLFDEEANQAWRESARSFCREEVNVICDNADSTSHAESWFGTLEEIARAWRFSLDEERRQLEGWIVDRETYPEEEEWKDRRSGGRAESAPGGTDQELDSLFSSLVARDRSST